MKTILVLFLLLSALASGDERILSYHSRIEVARDGMLDVTETIRVRSEGSEIRRGIFRDFPQLYQGRWGLKEKRPFEVTEVMRNGQQEPFVEEAHRAGTRVRIGHAERLIEPGEHTYTLRYRTGGQLAFFDTHDELYWNVTGNEWAFPIDLASVEVILPEGLSVASAEGYIGSRGSKEAAEVAARSGNRVVLQAARPLAAGEGLTVVVTWPSGALDAAVYERSLLDLLKDNPAALGGLLLVLAMLVWHGIAWVLVGRDPEPGLIIPRFEPPEGYSPAAVRMLDRMSFDNTCFSAAVMNLGVKGTLTIDGGGKSHTLRRKEKAGVKSLTTDEQTLFKKLLGERQKLELEQSNHVIISGARKALRTELAKKLEKSHFVANVGYWLPGLLLSLAGVGLLVISAPESGGAGFMMIWLSIWSIGTGALVSAVVSQGRKGHWIAALPMALFALPFVGGWVMGVIFFIKAAGVLAASAFVFAIVANFLFYHWIKAPTHLGRRVLDQVHGFKHYLTVAEEDRLGEFAGPQKTPELFEMFLPYAHALGVEQKWSEKFREVLEQAGQRPDAGGGYRPSFYTGSGSGFGGAMATAALGGALTSALTTASSSPSSSSGSGGGGSSGGGGGGGGGGGW